MPTKIRDANGNVVGYLEKRGDRILMLSPQGEESIGQFGDSTADTLGSGQTPEKIPYRDKEGNLQGWLCHEGERILFRGTNGAIDGYYEKKGDRIICRGYDGSIVSAFEDGPERDELFGSLEEEERENIPTPISYNRSHSVGAKTVVSTGLLSGCLAAGGWPAIFGVFFFSLIIAWFLSPLFALMGALAIWYVIRELRKPDTSTSGSHHRILAIILIILGLFELQAISCIATRYVVH